jgi:hypothetical protein
MIGRHRHQYASVYITMRIGVTRAAASAVSPAASPRPGRAARYCFAPMSKQVTPKHAVTPPKGRPTRPRHRRLGRTRLFGATAQWMGAIALLGVAFALLFVWLG